MRLVPLGRLPELLNDPECHLLAYTVQGCDARITRYKSRRALAAFCRPGSRHYAVVRDALPGNMITNPNIQRRND